MANLSFKEIAQSKPFRFIVGTRHREFFMHADLVASMSKVLNVTVNGSCNGAAKFEEALTNVAVWEDTDEDTFVRFCEFAYTGDYQAASPTKPEGTVRNGQCASTRRYEIFLDTLLTRSAMIEHDADVLVEYTPPDVPVPVPETDAIVGPESPVPVPEMYPIAEPELEPEPEPEPEPSEFNDFWLSSSRKKIKKKAKKGLTWEEEHSQEAMETRKENLWRKFTYLFHDLSAEFISANAKPEVVHTEVFLSHARIYTMADCYGVESLATKALGKLHRTLVRFRVFEERIPDIVTLIDYGFNNTTDKGGEQDGLRSLLCMYTACKLEDLWSDADFQNLFREHGDFSHGVLSNLLSRLS
ncbi:putative BTB domain-containing protein [Seiridium cardinale]